MSDDTPASPGLALAKANAVLALHSLALLQQTSRRTWERRAQHLSDIEQETLAEASQIAEAPDWQALAALPASAFWRLANRQVDAWKELTERSISAQSELAEGMRKLLAEWQHSTAEAMSQARSAMPLHAALEATLHGWADKQPPAAKGGR